MTDLLVLGIVPGTSTQLSLGSIVAISATLLAVCSAWLINGALDKHAQEQIDRLQTVE